MLGSQVRLPLAVPVRARVRSMRRPFHPSQEQGPYRLPREVHDRLTTALAAFKNRDAAYALAVFIARYHSALSRIIDAFPIDRRALADRPDLGLTEDRVRGAIRTLDAVGFLDRAVTSGSTHRKTEDGELHRKAILFRFGSDYVPAFSAANRRAAAARGRHSGERRAPVPSSVQMASTVNFRARPLKSPKATGVLESPVLMGEIVKTSSIPPQASELNPDVEAALERLRRGVFGNAGGG
jgi:hypothetical protein